MKQGTRVEKFQAGFVIAAMRNTTKNNNEQSLVAIPNANGCVKSTWPTEHKIQKST